MKKERDSGQMNLFDAREARRRRDAGMQLAESASRASTWIGNADDWLASQEPGTHFTSDDVTQATALPNHGQNRNNIVGAWFNAQCKKRRIMPTDRVVRSKRVTCHAAIQREWIVMPRENEEV